MVSPAADPLSFFNPTATVPKVFLKYGPRGPGYIVAGSRISAIWLRNPRILYDIVRMMSKTFGDLIRDRVEVYVNDIMVKTKRGSTLVEDLTLVFNKLRATRIKLNPDKCVFGVSTGKLLGFLVSHRGIEANPEKIKAIEAMRPLDRIKDIQKLTGSLAALSRFIPRLAERALPFFRLLRKSGPFSWTKKAERAFQELKQHLVSLPIVVAPELGSRCTFTLQ
jgi:hypothetical protein